MAHFVIRPTDGLTSNGLARFYCPKIRSARLDISLHRFTCVKIRIQDLDKLFTFVHFELLQASKSISDTSFLRKSGEQLQKMTRSHPSYFNQDFDPKDFFDTSGPIREGEDRVMQIWQKLLLNKRKARM
jgi:hypothetical protein